LGCLPLWGREGVTLLVVSEEKRTTEKKGFPLKIVLFNTLIGVKTSILSVMMNVAIPDRAPLWRFND
jgi:hypothetical protein